MNIFNIIVLSLSGLLLCYAGIMRLIKPIKSYCLNTYANNPEMKLEGKVDVFNEMRAAGALTFFAGIIILLGTFLPEMRITSFIVAIIIFFGFTVGRIISILLDGKPNKNLIQGLFSEIIFSILNTFCLVKLLIS